MLVASSYWQKPFIFNYWKSISYLEEPTSIEAMTTNNTINEYTERMALIMANKGKDNTINEVKVNNKRAWAVESAKKDNECPVKEGDNCEVPGVFGDSDPIGGS